MASTYKFTNEVLFIGFYGSIFIGSIGFLTNSLNLTVSLRENVRKTKMGFYVTFISIFNILAITVNILDFFPQSIGKQEFVLISTYVCATIKYFSRVLLQISQWLNVLISFDRLSLLKYRARQDQRPLNKKRLLLVVLGLVGIICVINVTNLFYYLDYTKINENNMASNNATEFVKAECKSNKIVDWIRDVVHILSRSVLPTIAQIIINGKIILKLIKMRNEMTNTQSMEREKKYAFVIVFYTLINILAEAIFAPSTIMLNIYSGSDNNFIQDSSEESAIWALAYFCSRLFGVFIICDISLFLNLSTNKKFRNETKKLLHF
jgi:hypothetical protein